MKHLLAALQPQRSIQAKITLWAGVCLFLASLLITWYTSFQVYQTALAAAQQEALAEATHQAVDIKTRIDEALYTAEALAEAFSAVRAEDPLSLNRSQVNRMLRELTHDNPNFVGTYTLWEPDAFDGRDSSFVNQHPYDATGRLIAYWNRNAQNDIRVETPLDYGVVGPGDYYQCPRQQQRECIIEPYLYPVQGRDVLMTSLVVPILANDVFYGIIGVDISVDFLQGLADQIDLYDGTATMALITYGGTLAAITDQPELIGADIKALHPQYYDTVKRQVDQGQTVAHEGSGGNVEVFVPIGFGETATPWVVNIIVPRGAIAAEPLQLIGQLVAISTVLTLGALALLWVIVGRITQPVRTLTAAARTIARGDLAVMVQPTSHDEVGELTGVFTQMVASLRQMVEVERQAIVAEREARAATEQVQQMQQRLIDAQHMTLRELSTPLIPISDTMVIMPLVGAIDRQRAEQIVETLLEGVAAHRAHLVILDITGVQVVDTQVAQAFIQAAQGVKLLGAQVMLTGIRPQIAQTLVELGVDLKSIETRSSLQAGITAALSKGG